MASFIPPPAVADGTTLQSTNGVIGVIAGGIGRAQLASTLRFGRMISRTAAFGAAEAPDAEAPAQTRYVGFGPDAGWNSVESGRQWTCPSAMTVIGGSVHVTANTLTTATATYTLRKNGVDTAMSVVVAAGSSGVKSLTGGPISFAAGDVISLKLVTAAGGAGTVTTGNVSVDVTE